jgi:glycosyltransferase involved in cell wall biosynthesis
MSRSDHRILCVLPGLPETRTGGGIVLYEIVAYLATRGHVEVVVPVPAHLSAEFEATSREGAFADVVWHPLVERRTAGLRGYVSRMLGAAPADVAKYAVEENRLILERCRATLEPTVELAISSWALAAYRDFALPKDARLYMVNVDPRIVTYFGPSLKRKVATLLDRPKVTRLCRRALTMAGRVGAISAADVVDLNRIGGREDVAYVPPLMRPRPLDRSQVEPFSVLITTNFAYPPNVVSLETFLRECWPLVDSRARLTVTGKDEAEALAALCDRHPRVTYAGCVSPVELDDLFARTAVAVNPTRVGSGFQVKLLDALARGVPVVSTQFSNRIGATIPSSDDPGTLAELIGERLVPGATPVFGYATFHRHAVAAWDQFLGTA